MKNDNKKWNDDWKENPVYDNILQFVSSLIFALFINLLSSFDFDMFYILSFSAAAFGGFLLSNMFKYFHALSQYLVTQLSQDNRFVTSNTGFKSSPPNLVTD